MMYKLHFVLALVLMAAFGATAETDPIAVLQQPDASLEAKIEACRLISISGDQNALPVLEPLLTDSTLSHMARYALEPMAGPEVDAALRRALVCTAAELKAGIIASIGVRRDVAAVPELIAVLADPNEFVVEAAARALGRIGVPEGVVALQDAAAQHRLAHGVIQALGDGLLVAAEGALAQGRNNDAAAIYDAAYAEPKLLFHARAAALRGAILARPVQDGLPMLLAAMNGENEMFATAALRIALEMPDKPAVAVGIAEALAGLRPDRKVPVMQTLGELGVESAGPALLLEAQTEDVALCVAALRASVRLAHAPVIPLLIDLLADSDEDVAKAAREGLSYFPGQEGDDAVRALLASNEAARRLIAVELIGQGALPQPVDLLLQTADNDADEAVRVAALKGTRAFTTVQHIPVLIKHLVAAQTDDERGAAEDGLVQLCTRQRTVAQAALPAEMMAALCGALASAEGPARLAVMRALAASGEQAAFDVVLPLTNADGPEVKDAALRAVCDWPTPLALSTLMAWMNDPARDAVKASALRGAVRLIMLGQEAPEALCGLYADVLKHAASAEDKKLVLSGLAKVNHACALNMALDFVQDETVKAEAVQAAIGLVKQLGFSPDNAAALERAKSLLPEQR